MKQATLIFIVFASVLVVWVTADTSRPFFSSSSSDTRFFVGSNISTTEKTRLEFDGTIINLDARTHFVFKNISKDNLVFFASRGHWSIEPDREITTCTRVVCATTKSPIDIRYYTPGEVVEIKTSGTTKIEFNKGGYILQAGDRIIIDELTKTVR